jgi:hypothetical protein
MAESANIQESFGLVMSWWNITVAPATSGWVPAALTVSPGIQTITATGQTA